LINIKDSRKAFAVLENKLKEMSSMHDKSIASHYRRINEIWGKATTL
jgi:hypothetical protein